jgi:hypothetical protein
MRRQYPSTDELRSEYGRHKTIPEQYQEVILRTLSHYPELKEVRLNFKLRKNHPEPYETVPSVIGAVGLKKSYTIFLLEEATGALSMALFKNLPEEAQMGIIGHLLSHVLQYEKKTLASILKLAASSPARKVEREADVLTIEHGLGFELYTFACYIRAIPGYVEERKQIDVNHLHPNEILECLPPEQLQELPS